MGIVLSLGVLINMWMNLINLMLLYFLIGIMSGVIGFLIWYKIRTKKFILKLEFM